MEVEDRVFRSIEEFDALSRDSLDWQYIVSWVDTSARPGQAVRGILSRARHAENGSGLEPGRTSPAIGVPFTPPVSLVNRLTVDLFNRAYFRAGSRSKGVRREHYQSYFFPLDAVANWNRMYGRRGFYQYQCVVPPEHREVGIGELMRGIQRSGEASFLVALKEFGDRLSPGLLSFPRPGVTLALDFPNRGDKTRRLLDSFDRVVRDVGGALYPAKDARMPADIFASGYPSLQAFRSTVDPRFSSAFWRRVQE
jgi:hypothetical protein